MQALEIRRVPSSADLLNPGQYVFIPKREPKITANRISLERPAGFWAGMKRDWLANNTGFVYTSVNAIAREATRTFIKGLDRKQRFDMNKNGLEIKAVCVGTEKESSTVTDNTITTVA